MKVCFVCGGFSANGGIGRVVSLLANELAKDDQYEIFLCSFYETESSIYYEIDSRCHLHELFDNPVSMKHALLLDHAVKKLVSYLIANRIDIVIACGALYYPLAVISTRICHILLVCWEHISPSITGDYWFQGQSRVFGAKRSDCNVVLTKYALKIYNQRFPSASNWQIYNPVDPIALEGGIPYNITSHKIVSVGRLCYQKNFERLIEIAEAVFKRHPDWIWDIYGEGENHIRLESLIRQKGLIGKVQLCGQVNDLYARYPDYAFFVMTSRYEGFPMVLLEASAHRLPMISFDIPGPDEIINDGVNGFLCPTDSDEVMIDRISYLIEIDSGRAAFSQASYNTAKEFDLSRIVQQWKKLFESAYKLKQYPKCLGK